MNNDVASNRNTDDTLLASHSAPSVNSIELRKEIPILFSTPMVQAILEGRKTMTRRIVKPQPSTIGVCGKTGNKAPFKYKDVTIMSEDLKTVKQISTEKEGPYGDIIKCPYGKPENLIWVREEHYAFGHWEQNGLTKTGLLKWGFVPETTLGKLDFPIRYSNNPSPTFRNSRNKGHNHIPQWYKRLARFMPKSAARIWLEVTDIRVERVQDISETDAIAEGVEQNCDGSWRDYIAPKRIYQDSAKPSFISLWQSINGEESWNANPWVWVVCFKVLSTTGKPNREQEVQECDANTPHQGDTV